MFGHGRIPPILEVSRRSFLWVQVFGMIRFILFSRRVSIMLLMMLFIPNLILILILVLVCIVVLVFILVCILILRILIISISISIISITTTCTADGIVLEDVIRRGYMVDFVHINGRDDRCND